MTHRPRADLAGAKPEWLSRFAERSGTLEPAPRYPTEFLSNRSLTTPQIRFIEMVIDQLTARGVMEPSALYEAPFSSVHAGGPEALFAGKTNVIEGIFEKLKTLQPERLADVG